MLSFIKWLPQQILNIKKYVDWYAGRSDTTWFLPYNCKKDRISQKKLKKVKPYDQN